MAALENMTVRELLLVYGPRLATISRDAGRMTARAFERKYGIDVREYRAKMKRLKELCDEPTDEQEVRALVRLFLCVCNRKWTDEERG
ncbi:MAG: hypothetical protein ACM3ZB_04555 [bacterium]